MREIEFDIDGPLVYKKRYRPWKDRKASIGQSQKKDGVLIQFVANQVGLNIIYDSEWPDYIEDYEGPKTKSGNVKLQQVFFDHVVFTGSHVIIFESDDMSHYNEKFCIEHNYDYADIKRRDNIKDIWARKNNILLVRLKEYKLENGTYRLVTPAEKRKIIFKILRDVKKIEDCV